MTRLDRECSSLARDTRESESQIAFSTELLFTEFAKRLGVAKKRIASLEAPPLESRLGKIDSLTTPFEASQMVQMFLNVSIDNLWMMFRYIRKVQELPMVAAYSLIRSSVEATSYGIWVLKGNGNEIKAQRSLRISLNNFSEHTGVQSAFSSKEFDLESMKQKISTLNSKLTGTTQEKINDRPQTTSIVQVADELVEGRYFFNGMQVWRSTSGLAHASQPAVSVLLERAPDGTRTSRMTFVSGFAMVAIENTEYLLERFIEHSESLRSDRHQ